MHYLICSGIFSKPSGVALLPFFHISKDMKTTTLVVFCGVHPIQVGKYEFYHRIGHFSKNVTENQEKG